MSELVNVLERFPAKIIETEDGLTVSDGFTIEKMDLDFLDYLSPQRMKLLATKTGKHYEWKYIKKKILSPDSSSKKLGRILHSALLEPEDFLKRYIVEPTFSGEGSRKKKKDWVEKLNPDALVMKKSEAELILNMIEALTSDKHANTLLSNGTPEVHAFAKDPVYTDHNGNPIQWYCIIDFLRSENIVVELKSTKLGKRRKFESDCLEYGYHIQTWICRRVVELITKITPKVMVIDVENNAPFCVAVNECPHNWFEIAQDYIHKGLNIYKDGMKTGVWYGWQKKPGSLLLPEYAELHEDEIGNKPNGWPQS